MTPLVKDDFTDIQPGMIIDRYQTYTTTFKPDESFHYVHYLVYNEPPEISTIPDPGRYRDGEFDAKDVSIPTEFKIHQRWADPTVKLKGEIIKTWHDRLVEDDCIKETYHELIKVLEVISIEYPNIDPDVLEVLKS